MGLGFRGFRRVKYIWRAFAAYDWRLLTGFAQFLPKQVRGGEEYVTSRTTASLRRTWHGLYWNLRQRRTPLLQKVMSVKSLLPKSLRPVQMGRLWSGPLDHWFPLSWRTLDDSKELYLKIAKLGPNPIMTVREPGSPVGLKVITVSCHHYHALMHSWGTESGSHMLCECTPASRSSHRLNLTGFSCCF